MRIIRGCEYKGSKKNLAQNLQNCRFDGPLSQNQDHSITVSRVRTVKSKSACHCHCQRIIIIITYHRVLTIGGLCLLAMSTSRALQRLHSLGTSSPDLLRCLYDLIQSDDEEQYLTSLRGSELTRLVDFLDRVRSSPLVPC